MTRQQLSETSGKFIHLGNIVSFQGKRYVTLLKGDSRLKSPMLGEKVGETFNKIKMKEELTFELKG